MPLEVFTQRNFVADFIRLKLNFIQKKKQKIAFWDTLWGLKGNVRTTHSIYRSHSSLWSTFYSSQLNFFAICYGWVVISGNLLKSAFFEGGGSLWAQISDGRGHRQPTTVGVRKLVIALSCGIKISAVHCLVLSQSTRVTDRQTDRQAELRQLIPR